MVLIKSVDDDIVTIEMRQPGGNKFTSDLLDKLINEISKLKLGEILILTGYEKIFSVGGDITSMVGYLDKGDPAGYVKEIVPKVNQLILEMIKSCSPIITAINGSAAGGGLSLAMAGDFRIGVQEAKLSFAFGRLALSPDSGSTLLLPRYFSNEFLLEKWSNGGIITADEAYRVGALTELTSHQDLLPVAKEKAKKLQSGSLWTFARSKELLWGSDIATIQRQLNWEYDLIKKSCKRPEFEELVRSLNHKLSNA